MSLCVLEYKVPDVSKEILFPILTTPQLSKLYVRDDKPTTDIRNNQTCIFSSWDNYHVL